ncbi:MAG: transposase-like protein [Gammaproteobacteria bacterium]|jgi:transposase-like protein
MNKGIGFTDAFKQGAVAQVVERSYAVSELSLGWGSTPNRFALGRRNLRSRRASGRRRLRSSA